MKYKRIYQEFSYGKELIGYQCEKAFIKIEYEFNGAGSLLGTTKKWYHVEDLKKIGEASCFDTLKEAKECIEKCL